MKLTQELIDKIDWDHNNGIVTMVPLTQEELECVRVCVSNAPIPVSYTHLTLPTILRV